MNAIEKSLDKLIRKLAWRMTCKNNKRPSESFGMPVKQLLQPLGKVKKGHSI